VGVECILALLTSDRMAWVRSLAAYVFGSNLAPLTSAPSDHDGWEKVVACCSCCPVAGTLVGDRFASGADVGRDGRPLPCP